MKKINISTSTVAILAPTALAFAASSALAQAARQPVIGQYAKAVMAGAKALEELPASASAN